jgi:DnaK suppressor protein
MIDYTPFRARLEEQLKTISEELESIATYDSVNDDWKAVPNQEEAAADADENTSADFIEEWNQRRATVSDLEREYRDIKRALNKITEGTYGLCEVSGEPIEEKRLEARPDARTCIAHMNEEGQLPL